MEAGCKEEINAEDEAWGNMSYADRLLWYLDNKILKSKGPSSSVAAATTAATAATAATSAAADAVEETASAVEETPVEETAAAEETSVEASVEESVEPVKEQAPPKNKRSTKEKKINIEL